MAGLSAAKGVKGREKLAQLLEQRIRKLAAYVKENDLHLTEFYFYDANWSFCGEDEIQEIKDMDEYKHSDHRSKTQLNEDRFLSRMPPICGYAVQALYLSVRKHSAERHLQIH